MRNNWKKVPHSRSDGKWKSIHVTMTPKGEIAMNKAAWQAARQPQFVELLIDPANSQIGLQPTNALNPDRYKVCHWKSSRSYRISARRALEDLQVKLPATVKFHDVELVQNILVLDLRTARVPASVTNHHRNRHKKIENGSWQVER